MCWQSVNACTPAWLTWLPARVLMLAGHAVFPSLYASLRNKSQFPTIIAATFAVVVLIYGSMAVMG